jgi:hypothetical protein
MSIKEWSWAEKIQSLWPCWEEQTKELRDPSPSSREEEKGNNGGS